MNRDTFEKGMKKTARKTGSSAGFGGYDGRRAGRWKLLPLILLLLLLALLLPACGAGAPADEKDASEAGAQNDHSSVMQTDLPEIGSPSEENPQAEAGQEAAGDAALSPEEQAAAGTQAEQPVPAAENNGSVTVARLSFASYIYVDTGDESISKMIRNVEIPVQTADSSQEALLYGIVEALRHIPQGLEGAETMVSDLYRINSIAVDNGTAVVDVAGGGIANASPFDEEFFVYQVADSILHSVPAIRKVRFTVDGSGDQGFLYLDMHQEYDAGACDAFCG